MNWEDYENLYRPIYTEKMQLLGHLLKPIEPVYKDKRVKELKVVQFIKEFSLKALTTELSIFVKHHSLFPEIVMLTYDGVNSPLESPIVQECNRLILDISQNYKPVAMGYSMFFNYGEKVAANVEFEGSSVYEKVERFFSRQNV